ncbi:STAS domain-containing protein [Hyphomicrobium sp. NDB2Meth4]|uniref:STAS domain-containing protein n=1 Tax=Hyphomicrobium sp. NDB2Meth4 TaxID=1892846 RepID=UPI0009306C41|nr:STAS domain-containing protein [Hyphomicrobium sp. NDB2Meth4]
MSRTGKSSKSGTRRGTTGKLQLAEVLDLTAAAPLAQSLLPRRGSDLTIDASKVRRVGAQCLQVLLSAEATWKADGVRLTVENPTDEFLASSELLGIQISQDTARAEPA